MAQPAFTDNVNALKSTLATIGATVRSVQSCRKAKELQLQADAETAETQLLAALDSAQLQINAEYDNHLAQGGPQFGQGDGNKKLPTDIKTVFTNDTFRNCKQVFAILSHKT